jgi:hypothetical protein
MKEQVKPIKINSDIWFYVNKKSIDFVVWTSQRECIQFKITEKKLKKYILED